MKRSLEAISKIFLVGIPEVVSEELPGQITRETLWEPFGEIPRKVYYGISRKNLDEIL